MLKQFTSPIVLKADSATGEFMAVFSTMNVKDKDGDVTVPGAFKEGQAVRIAQWGHNWDALPVGKGTIHSDEYKAWVNGQFFLDTPHGLATFQTVKGLGEIQEWSYGFTIEKRDYGDFNGEQVRFLRALDVAEVSPVMIGAGVGTRTIEIRAAKADDTTYADQAVEAVAVLEAFVERSQAATAARAKEGRPIGRANRERIRSVLAAMDAFAEVRADLEALIAESEPEPPKVDDPPKGMTPTIDRAAELRRLFAENALIAASSAA